MSPGLAFGEAASRQTAKTGVGAVPIPTAQPIPAGSTTWIADDVVFVLAQSAIPDVVAAGAGANTAIPHVKAGEADALAGKTGCVEDDPEEPSSAAETAPSPGQSPATIAGSGAADPRVVPASVRSRTGRCRTSFPGPHHTTVAPLPRRRRPTRHRRSGAKRHLRRCCGWPLPQRRFGGRHAAKPPARGGQSRPGAGRRTRSGRHRTPSRLGVRRRPAGSARAAVGPAVAARAGRSLGERQGCPCRAGCRQWAADRAGAAFRYTTACGERAGCERQGRASAACLGSVGRRARRQGAKRCRATATSVRPRRRNPASRSISRPLLCRPIQIRMPLARRRPRRLGCPISLPRRPQ